jgi:hypothetical protein
MSEREGSARGPFTTRRFFKLMLAASQSVQRNRAVVIGLAYGTVTVMAVKGGIENQGARHSQSKYRMRRVALILNSSRFSKVACLARDATSRL